MLSFVKPTDELVHQIADNMRKEDVQEVWASNHHTPLESLMKGWVASDFTTVVTGDDGPIAMIGLVKRDVLSGSGIVWLLGTTESVKYRKQFLTLTKPVIDEMLTICPRLCNMVHAKNRTSVRWLKWLGFHLDDPIPHGPDKELFHRFHMERRDSCVNQPQ